MIEDIHYEKTSNLKPIQGNARIIPLKNTLVSQLFQNSSDTNFDNNEANLTKTPIKNFPLSS